MRFAWPPLLVEFAAHFYSAHSEESSLQSEVRSVASLAALYAIRMLGLFMVLPILASYGLALEGANTAMLGLAIGIYGLTQAAFQIPLGMLSDKIGRKPVIVFGLLVFALGSVVAALSDSVGALIIGRALQGSGAIASTIMALVSDLTSEESRTKAMAGIGASIGLSFSVALILGPALAGLVGLSGIFFLAAGLSLLGILIALFIVPSPPKLVRHRDTGATPAMLLKTLMHGELVRLYIGIFSLHAVLTALFVAVPLRLLNELGLASEGHWKVYLPVILLSFLIAVPTMIIAERKQQVKPMLIASIVLLLLSECLFLSSSIWLLLFAILVFFVGFNSLEAMMPSLASKLAPAGAKGAVMGVYSTSQFFGAFAGGAIGGLIVSLGGVNALYLCCSLLLLVWLASALTMRKPRHLSSLCFQQSDGNQHQAISALKGVEEAVFVQEENMFYLKVDKKLFDSNELDALVR